MGGPGSGRRPGGGTQRNKTRPKMRTKSTFRKGDSPSPKRRVGYRPLSSLFRGGKVKR